MDERARLVDVTSRPVSDRAAGGSTRIARRRRWRPETVSAVILLISISITGCQSDADRGSSGAASSLSASPAATPIATPSPTQAALATADDLNDPTSAACGVARGVLVTAIQENWQPVADIFTGPVELRTQQLEEIGVVSFNLKMAYLQAEPALQTTWPCLGAPGDVFDAACAELNRAQENGWMLEERFAAVQSAVDALVASSPPRAAANPTPSSQTDSLRDTFDAMLAAVAVDGESGLLPFLADQSAGDVWGVSSWEWTDPLCQDDAVQAEGAQAACQATFTKDGERLENLFTFAMSDGMWRLTESWVWGEGG